MNYTGITAFFDNIIYKNGLREREIVKQIIRRTQAEHFKNFNEREYIRYFNSLYLRCSEQQANNLALFYVRVFLEPRISAKRPVAIFWKKIDSEITAKLLLQISDDDEPEIITLVRSGQYEKQKEDLKKIGEDIKKSVIEDLEKKRQADELKLDQERKERIRIKKINKRKRLKERKELKEQDNKFNDEIQTLQNIIDTDDEQNTGSDTETKNNTVTETINNKDTEEKKIDWSKCSCGSKTARKDLHEKTLRHKNFIEFGIIHKNKTQQERNIKRYAKNNRIITRCACGEMVKKSSKLLHEQSKKHKYFMEHGQKIQNGNHMVRCDCGVYFMRYNTARHRGTLVHLNYLRNIQDI